MASVIPVQIGDVSHYSWKHSSVISHKAKMTFTIDNQGKQLPTDYRPRNVILPFMVITPGVRCQLELDPVAPISLSGEVPAGGSLYRAGVRAFRSHLDLAYCCNIHIYRGRNRYRTAIWIAEAQEL